MRKSIPLIVLAALLVAPTAFAQSTGHDDKSVTRGNKADTPAQQKERNKDYSKVPGAPGNKSGPARRRVAKAGSLILENGTKPILPGAVLHDKCSVNVLD